MLHTTKIIVLAAVFSLLNINLVAAQITPDNTLGSENSTVRDGNINGLPSDVIEGGATRGTNLFHSFQEFNVPENRGAYFNPDSTINNVLTRVTGSNVSNINGTLGVIGNANLFLLNPNGILFGPNAKLDLNGSFLGTTADSILFNNYQFSATEKNPAPDALLTINIPLGLQLNNNQSKITVNSNIGEFKVKPEQFLTLIGGDITFDGGVILSPNSNINFGGLLEAGEVNLTGFIPTFPNNITRGNVTLSNGANVNVRDDGNGLGSITINSNNLDVTGGSRIRAGIGANLGTPNTQAKDININATGNVTIDGGGIFNQVRENAKGNAGNINIISNNIDLNNDSFLSVNNLGQGNAGNINLDIKDTAKFDYSSVYSFVEEPTAIGNGGNINIKTSNLEVVNGTNIAADTYGIGNAGNIIINATDSVKFDGVSSDGYDSLASSTVKTDAVGNAGKIDINTGNLTVSNGAYLSTTSGGLGKAGSIIIKANNTELSNQSYLSSSAVSPATSGGLIDINTGDLTLNNESYIKTSSDSIADAGNVKITSTGNINFSSDSYIVTASIGGNGGDVSIETTGDITLSNSKIYSNSSFATDTNHQSGDININANSLTLKDDSTLFSLGSGIDNNTGSNAGNITIKTSPFGFIKLDQGSIMYSSTMNAGAGGNVLIETGKLSLFNGSQIYTGVDGSKDAGSLTINASETVELVGSQKQGDFFIYYTPNMLATTTNGSGNAGKLTIETPILLIQDGGYIETRTSGVGKAGELIINAPVAISLIGNTPDGLNASSISSLTTSTGNASNIQLNTGKLTVKDGGYISTESLFAEGAGGNLNITATDSIEVSGNRSLGGNPSSLSATTSGSGDAGNIQLNTNSLIVKDGGEISSQTLLGKGLGGNVDITANSSVNIEGANTLTKIPSRITTKSFLNSEGNAGNISLTTGELTISNRGEITALTNTSGKAGSININADNTLIDTSGKISANTTNSGDAGTISITSKNLNLTNLGLINTQTTGTGNAGNIELNTNSLSLTNTSYIFAITNGQGDSGNIKITADNISLEGDNNLITNTVLANSTGNGGIIDIISNSLLLNGFGGITSLSQGQGNAGDINVNSNLVKLSNGGNINASTQGTLDNAGNIIKYSVGNAGNININSQDLIVEGVDSQGRFSNISAVINQGGQGNSGNITINTNNLRISDGGEISNQIVKQAKGNGGNININVTDSFKIDGFTDYNGATSQVNSATLGEGDAGNININANYLELTNGGLIGAATRTNAMGKGGNIDITANNLTINNAVGIDSSTFSDFEAGNINIKVVDNLTISGKYSGISDGNSGITARTYEGSTGKGGSIFIDPNTVNITDGARIAVDSKGTGTGGNISLSANTLNLDNGTITAATNSTDGGSIDLNIANNLNLRNASEITASAGKSQGAGNGGNLNLNADFIINYPDNNKITANAYAGNGGNIIITTNGILGPQYLDITASSELGLQGNIEMNIPKTDPASGLIQTEKPSIDIAALFAKDFCKLSENSSFVYIGRGGKVVTPDDNNDVETGLMNWVDNPYSSDNNTTERSEAIAPPITEKTEEITEIRQAQGWVKLPDGTIVLTAHPVEVTPMGVKLLLPNCN